MQQGTFFWALKLSIFAVYSEHQLTGSILFWLELFQDERWIRYILSKPISCADVRLCGPSYCLPALALTLFSALIRRLFVFSRPFGNNQPNVAVCLTMIAQFALLPTFRPGELVQIQVKGDLTFVTRDSKADDDGDGVGT